MQSGNWSVNGPVVKRLYIFLELNDDDFIVENRALSSSTIKYIKIYYYFE